LQDELTPEVEDKDVTVRRADLGREVRSLISYAVGCMFGRYSLDYEGLAYAGGKFSDQWAVVSGQYYLRKVLEDYGCIEFSGINSLAEGDATGKDGLSDSEKATQGRNIRLVGSNATRSDLDPIQHCGGTSSQLDEGVHSVSVDSAGFESRTANSNTAMQGNRLPCRYGYKGNVGFGRGSEQNARCPQAKTDRCPLTTNHYHVDADNVLPMLDGDWFADDIAERFRKFLRAAFGDEHYKDNLTFVEQALNSKGKRGYGIRDYFLNEFYADHVKIYKKRPIYWLFSSPKGSFNALVYMHRYRPETVGVVLNDYLREFRTKLAARKAHLEAVSISGRASQGEKTGALKEIEKITRMIVETEEYERDVLYPLATRRLGINLDDGVKVNYLKFGAALKKIPGLEAKEE
jgi:hypothetical protein